MGARGEYHAGANPAGRRYMAERQGVQLATAELKVDIREVACVDGGEYKNKLIRKRG